MPHGVGELALAAAGVGLAASAAAFAVSMLSDRNRTPTFSGAEHLMIFARPASGGDPGKSQARTRDDAPTRLDVDDMPVGSIKPSDAGSWSGQTGGAPQ